MLLPLALAFSGAVAMLAGYPVSLAVMALLTVLIAGRFGWFAAMGLPYAGLGALALLWLRLQPQRGLHDTMFLVHRHLGHRYRRLSGRPGDRRA